jgi:hypothetical protein
VCGNGVREAGETCDPPGSCPLCDDQDDCTTDTSTGAAATCNLVCNHAVKTCSLAGKDRCCPAGCDAATDSDCAGCGDGVVEPEMGETCDPPGSCPTPEQCVSAVCWETKTYTGSASRCNARCSTVARSCSGRTSDGCCPPGCNTTAATLDVDCPAVCGNGQVETGELCDPASQCPSSCPQNGCDLRTLQNAGTCTAQCAVTAQQTACVNNDRCCPRPACNATSDNDCSPVCGNAVREGTELCDGDCPTACPAMGCQLRRLVGSATTCDARCENAAIISECRSGDGCCGQPAPGQPACNANNDAECGVMCGNGVVEGNELCDGNCPTSCPVSACRVRTLAGSAATCNARCVDAGPVVLCQNNDGCCGMPGAGQPACNANNDNNCSAVCGNGVVEGTEACDGNCPTACPVVQCTLRTLTGTGCDRRCVDAGPVAACQNGDGCCGIGTATAKCNANNDDSCPAACGNGVVEAGETCDPVADCQSRFNSCVEDRDTVRVRGGSVAACTFTCTETPRQCGPSDRFCPSNCPRDNNDPDCAPPNDKCAGALDISAGGVFTVNVTSATAQDVAGQASCPVQDGPDVFFRFELGQPEFVYIAVLSANVPAPVNLSLELFGDPECGVTGAARLCPNPEVAGRLCGREPFPAIDQASKPLGAGKYSLAVRAPKGVTGQWNLFYQHIPIVCVDGPGALVPGQTLQQTTCQHGDTTTPSCGATSRDDLSYVVVKCPNAPLAFAACAERPPLPVLSALWTSMRADATRGMCTPVGNTIVDRCGPAPTAACPAAATVTFTPAIPGMVFVSVDSTVVVGGPACGPFNLQYQTGAGAN